MMTETELRQSWADYRPIHSINIVRACMTDYLCACLLACLLCAVHSSLRNASASRSLQHYRRRLRLRVIHSYDWSYPSLTLIWYIILYEWPSHPHDSFIIARLYIAATSLLNPSHPHDSDSFIIARPYIAATSLLQQENELGEGLPRYIPDAAHNAFW